MIILTTSSSAQEIKFIPREYAATSIVIHNEDTNTSTTYNGLTFTTEAYYLKTNITFNPVLKEGTFYNISVLNNSDVIYKDNIFCTDQNIEGYSINKNEYTEHETTNEYIVLWQMIYS